MTHLPREEDELRNLEEPPDDHRDRPLDYEDHYDEPCSSPESLRLGAGVSE